MKPVLISSLTLVANVAALGPPLQRRQFDIFGLSSASGPAKAPVSTTKIKSKIQDGAIRERVLWGPFGVKPANASHKATGMALKLDPNSDIISSGVNGLCKNCMVLYAQADLAKKDGNKADIGSGVYSHHLIMTDIGHPMVAPPVMVMCPNGRPGSMMPPLMPAPKRGGSAAQGGMSGGHAGHMKRQVPASGGGLSGILSALGSLFGGGKAGGGKGLGNMMGGFRPSISVFIGQGDEGSAMSFTVKNSPIKSGFWIGANDKFNVMSEVINYDNFPKDMYISMEYEYIPMPSRPKEYYDVGMGAINVSPCSTIALYPPVDKPMKYVSPAWRVMADGYLLDLKPHLHDGGINMTFLVNGKNVCSSQALYGGTDGGLSVGGQKWETITAYSPCDTAVQVKRNDNLTMEVWYDLTRHRLRPQSNDHNEEAEGMALANFLYAKPVV